jgi:hypothetical protein
VLGAPKSLTPSSPASGVADAANQRVLRDRGDDVQQRSRATPLPCTLREYEAQIIIDTGGPLAGQLPIRALRLIREWTGLHQAELRDNWERAQARTPLASIDPLP